MGTGNGERAENREWNEGIRNTLGPWLTLDSAGGRGGDGATESGSAVVLSSLRCCECEVTGDCLSTSGGGSWGRSYSIRPLPLEVRSTSYSTRQSDRTGESDSDSSHDRNTLVIVALVVSAPSTSKSLMCWDLLMSRILADCPVHSEIHSY